MLHLLSMVGGKEDIPDGAFSPYYLAAMKKQAVVQKKRVGPQINLRQISGDLWGEGLWINPYSYYRFLKPPGGSRCQFYDSMNPLRRDY